MSLSSDDRRWKELSVLSRALLVSWSLQGKELGLCWKEVLAFTLTFWDVICIIPDRSVLVLGAEAEHIRS